MIDLSIIIVSYNTREFLRDGLCSLEDSLENSSKQISYEVIIVDNASTDNSTEMIKDEYPNFILVENKKNVGFSKANNQGVKVSKGRYLLFLNPDTIVRPKTIETIVSFMEAHKDVGAATCRVELLNGALDDACHRGFPTPWNAFCYFAGLSKLFPRSKLFSGYTLGWEDLTRSHEIEACAGAFMIVRREAGEQVGWWDEDFFWYGEDLDFCYRLKQKGWKVYYIPEASVLHYKGISGGIREDSKDLSTASEGTRKLALKARFEAMRLFYRKHYEGKYPQVVTWFVLRAISLKEYLS